jgi:hypothetical protein
MPLPQQNLWRALPSHRGNAAQREPKRCRPGAIPLRVAKQKQQRKTESKHMKFNVQIRGDVGNTFAKKNGDKVNERLLTCIDLTPEAMVADTFEVLAENLPFNEAGSLVGKTAELHVHRMVSRNVGVRLVGKVNVNTPARQS